MEGRWKLSWHSMLCVCVLCVLDCETLRHSNKQPGDGYIAGLADGHGTLSIDKPEMVTSLG